MDRALGNTFGVLQMLFKRLTVMTATVISAHADLTAQCSSTYQVLWAMTISVTQEFETTGALVSFTQMTLSGMGKDVTCNQTAATFTPHHGSVRSSQAVPVMI